nr:NB-ARC domains-containing protein [Tanacetum cinerariifolium]
PSPGPLPYNTGPTHISHNMYPSAAACLPYGLYIPTGPITNLLPGCLPAWFCTATGPAHSIRSANSARNSDRGHPTSSGQATTLPHAFNAVTIHNITSRAYNIDTGVSSHLNSSVTSLSENFNTCMYPSISVGDYHSIPVTNTGHSILPTPYKSLHLNNVLITHHILKNLIYVRQFVRDNNCTIKFDAFGFSVKDFMTRQVLLRCDSTGDLYPVTAPSPIPHAFFVSQHTWHQRLGHPWGEVLCRLVSSNFNSCNKEKPPSFQCDHDGEFDNRRLHSFFAQNGIQFRFSCPQTSQQNGKSKRMVRTINNLIRTLLFQANLPPTFWVEDLNMAIYLLNILPLIAIANDIPYNTPPENWSNVTLMASINMMPYVSSSTSSRLSQGYDVFMSFQGEDTRTGFTSHLYDAFIRNDIKTYKDDKTLEIGNPIASELLEAIEASKIAIVVLSNNFATSKWCLEEIAKIVKCKEHSKLIVIPVFYHVDPSDVRHQGNCFQKGFSDHEANPDIAPQNVERWRDAFRKVGALSGFHVTQHRNEAEVITEIVKLILKKMPDTLPIDVTKGLVGIDSRMDEDISKQDNSSDLCKLQQKLLDDILKEKSVRVGVNGLDRAPESMSNVRFPQGLSYLSNDLRILEWFECSLKSLPSNFKPTHIYEIEMCYSQLKTLWEETLVFPNLRSIDLSFSKELIKIPDLTSTPKLVKLNLKGCTKLKELHESLLRHKSLKYINLTGCTHLQSLGRNKMEMESLVTLLLSGCSNLEYIPEFGQNMKCLENLYLDGTNIKKLPESLGELHNLRKLDASETSIEEIPLSIRYMKRLRLLLPDFIGLLHRLISLDLSGNDFVHLPASISLLSNLKMLCLNSCKRLQSVPKLSKVNEDTLSGLPSRFRYIMSGEEVDVSKFHAASNNTSPTISCLNCPRLAQNHKGSYLAERALNSYLQLRTKYWMTPEAVFEIVGSGSEIPSTFTMRKADETFSFYGPWVGLAICAVISLRHIDANTETKYVLTAHINDGETRSKIPVPVHMVPWLENQLVFYWTITDDLQRMVMPSKWNKFHVSFIVEPR